jgi:hypothetical protein
LQIKEPNCSILGDSGRNNGYILKSFLEESKDIDWLEYFSLVSAISILEKSPIQYNIGEAAL